MNPLLNPNNHKKSIADVYITQMFLCSRGLLFKYMQPFSTRSSLTARSLTETKKKTVAYFQNYLCKKCNNVLSPSYQIDHIIPVALGGTSGNLNLQALCKSCHSLKTQQDLISIRDEKQNNPDNSDIFETWTKMLKNTSTTTTKPLPIDLNLDHLNTNQTKAVLHNDPTTAVRVVAGPGTGKTAVLTTRVACLISKFDIPPKNILTLTFTNRAAREMRERIVDLVRSPSIAEQITMGTFHATCLSLLRTTIHKVGVLPSFNEQDNENEDVENEIEDEKGTNKQKQQLIYPYRRGFGIYDETESLKVIRDIMRKTLGWTAEEAQPSEYQALISSAKSHGLSDSQSYATSKQAKVKVAKVFALYEETLRLRNQIDFDDMLWLTVELLAQDEDVLNRCRKKWSHILVDEFQDTNGMQFELLRLLAGKGDNNNNLTNENYSTVLSSPRSPPSSLFVVGDADQAIYGFRGAEKENQMKYDVMFDPAIYRLDQNYRSIQPILNVAHRLILPNYIDQELDASINYLTPLQGLSSESTEAVKVIHVEDETNEANYIVDECLRLRQAEKEAIQQDATLRPIDVAILMRTNGQFRGIERQLIREGVEHVVVNGTRFFDRREVRDIISYLKVVSSPTSSDLALERIINVPPRLIGEVTMLKLTNISTLLKISLWEVLEQLVAIDEVDESGDVKSNGGDNQSNNNEDDKNYENEDDNNQQRTANNLLQKIPTRSKNQLKKFKKMIDDIYDQNVLFHHHNKNERTNSGNDPISQAIISILKSTGYDDWIRYENDNGTDRWSNCRELVNFASGNVDLEQWLDEVALLSDPHDLSNDNNTSTLTSTSKYMQQKPVKLMTIHAAKGSEFEVVFLAGVEEELLPHHYSLMDDEVDEERRLCYVAVTRAKRRVVMTYCKERYMWGQRKDVQPSRFLMDLHQEEVQFLDLSK